MDESRFDRLARLVATRSRRQVLGSLAGAAAAALLGSPAAGQITCASSPCDPNASCVDSPGGGFTCTCNTGFTGDGTTCTDVDECAAGSNPCDVNATCTNEPGSFSCACNPGYAGNGFTCTAECDPPCTGTDVCAACTGACTEQPPAKCCPTAKRTNCSGVCVNTRTNDNNCGSCGKRCRGSKVCRRGRCVAR
jgi:hypothetical protein